MEVTLWTWVIAGAGLALALILGAAQVIAVLRPRADWTIDNIYGGRPEGTDPKAYFAFYRGFALADVFFWLPLQIAGSIGMLLGMRWGFLLALIASVPFWYTSIQFFIWDRDLGYRKPTLGYWLFTWGMFPAFGVLEGAYCLARLL